MFPSYNNKYDLTLNTTITDDATVTGSIDLNLFDASALTFLVIVGSVDIGVTAIKIQESANNSDWTDVTGANFNGAVLTASSDNTLLLQPIAVAGRQRYLRFSALVANGTVGCQFTVVTILGSCGTFPRGTVAATYGADVTFAGQYV